MAGISDKAAGGIENKYKYNGIELDTSLGLNEYDAPLRDLDPQTGRWWQVDPLTEDQEMWSPYTSNNDNPILYQDPRGNEGEACCEGLKEWASKVYEGAKEEVKNIFSPENLTLGTTLINLVENPKATTNEIGQALNNGSIVGTVDNAINNPKEFGKSSVDATVAVVTDEILKIPPEVKLEETEAAAPKGLDNPFKKATIQEVRSNFEERVKRGTMEKKGPNAYKHTKSGYSYNVDEGGNYGKGGKKVEKPHIDVNYPNPKPKNVPPKKKLEVK